MNDEPHSLPPPREPLHQRDDQRGGAEGPPGESRLHRFVSSFGHLIGTMVEMGFTRVELIFVELQEWVEGLVRIFFWAVVMIFAAGVALLVGALALIFAFWENRVMVALLEMGAFALLTLGAVLMIRRRLSVQRGLLASTLAEFARDRELFRRSRPPGGAGVAPASPVVPAHAATGASTQAPPL